MKICPRCKLPYYYKPALSRRDNKTLICPQCGTEEGLIAWLDSKGATIPYDASVREDNFAAYLNGKEVNMSDQPGTQDLSQSDYDDYVGDVPDSYTYDDDAFTPDSTTVTTSEDEG